MGELKYVRDQQGEMVTTEKEVRNRCREYFSALLNVDNEREQLKIVEPTEGAVQNTSKEEIRKTVRGMKSGKAAGCSGVVVELIKTLGITGRDMVHIVNESIWEEATMPDDRGKSIIVPVYKPKGDPLDCGNHRGIKLLEYIMRLSEKILDQRL